MSHNLEHQKVHTRMVKEVLKAVARANNHPYKSVFADFITGHPSCSVCFWETFHKMYMSKKTAGGRNTARYLGRYLKKPPIAASRLTHYNGGASLSFRYLDHKTGETATETLTQRELVARLKQHIPEKFFKMVRYFGFLANRVCGEKLPQVYRALGMDKPEPVAKVCYAQMVKQFLSRDPFECVLCGGRMVYRRAIAGLNVEGLKKNARDISLLRYMPA